MDEPMPMPVPSTPAPSPEAEPKPTKKKPGRKPGSKHAAHVEQAAAAVPAGIAPTAEQWAQMMAVLAGNKEADMEVAATIHARAMKKALRPENEIAPGISVYNPKGEIAHPRTKPTHIFMQGPYPICSPQDYNTSTATEIELCNALQPGDYMVTKADGMDVKVTVKTDYESNGTKPYRTTIVMPMADDDQKANWVPLVQMLTQINTGEAPMASFTRYQSIIDQQAAEIAALKAASAA